MFDLTRYWSCNVGKNVGKENVKVDNLWLRKEPHAPQELLREKRSVQKRLH